MQHDWDKIEIAFAILENAEVMQVFEDSVWLKVDKETWNYFQQECME